MMLSSIPESASLEFRVEWSCMLLIRKMARVSACMAESELLVQESQQQQNESIQ
jgi:hypothetical protein